MRIINPTLAAGASISGGFALDLDGTSGHLNVFSDEVVPAAYQSIADTFSLAAWIRPEDVGSGAEEAQLWIVNKTIVEFRTRAGPWDVPFGFGLHGGKLALGVSANLVADRELGSTTLTAGTYYLAGVSVLGNSCEFFLNGVSDGSGSFTPPVADRYIGTEPADMQFGSRARDSGQKDRNLFDGLIHDPRIYNSVLSSADWAALAAGSDISSGLIGRWPMTEGSGTTAADTIGGNTGSLVGGITWSATTP